MNKPNYDKMTRTQKKTEKTDPIPMDKILEYNEKELRPIANRQIESLKKRGAWTGNYPVYIHEINKVILQEKGEI
jgi:hypothetical protein